MKIVETKRVITLDELAKLDEDKKEKESADKKAERKTLHASLLGMEGGLSKPKLSKKPKKEKGKGLGSFSGIQGNLVKTETEQVKNDRLKKANRFYLPVLNINDVTQHDSQPLENRLHFTDKVAYNTCIGNCCGVPGLKAGCCYLDPDDIEHVLGPLDEEWISGFVKHLRKQGLGASRHDVVVDFEEGKLIGDKWFSGTPKNAVFQSPDSYPILRMQLVGPRFACKFLNFETGKCTIYAHRPDMCRDYLCQYVKANFLVRTKQHPNTYSKIR